MAKKALSVKTSEKTGASVSPDISVLVPVMNEAGNIRPLIDEICTVFSGRLFEIIYIDDASSDSTPEELAAAMQIGRAHV